MKKHSKTLTDVSKRMMIEQGMNMVAGLDLGDKYSHVWLIDLAAWGRSRRWLSY